jgi:asparagine synthase (glutamine-hydrolysing)
MIELPRLAGVAETAGLWDAGTYLPDDILTKVDRASMATSLETRAPLLDHRVLEFALSLPEHFKTDRHLGKKVLREVLYRYVPKAIVDRPKTGFSIPLSQWLRRDLRDWAQTLVDSIPVDGSVFDKAAIDDMWSAHLGGSDHTERIWGVLSLASFIRARRH